jgi:uncharacterized protein
MTYKILSLDGGGTWAMLEAMALKELYGDVPGRQILSDFDLAVANSGGSIVLAGLIENMPPSQIISLFNDQANREQIFVRVPFLESLLSHIPIFPRYSASAKLTGLSALFGATGDTSLKDFPADPTWPKGPNVNPVKILITGFDYDALRATFFRSYDIVQSAAAAATATASETHLVCAVHASSNAPVTFFDAPALFDNSRYWDGAMAGFNNPLMAGVIDLIASGASASEIAVLSIGTGTVKLLPPDAPGVADANLKQTVATQNVINDLGKAAGCINDDPPDNASYSAHVILGAARNADLSAMGAVVRLSPVVRPVLRADNVWVVPDGLTPTQFDGLAALAMDAVEQDQVALIQALGEAWIAGTAPNAPIRMVSSTLAGEPGDDTFAAGKARWQVLSPPPAAPAAANT